MNDLFTYNQREADIERREARRLAYERVVGHTVPQPVEPQRFVYLRRGGLLYVVLDMLTRREFCFYDDAAGRAAMWRWRGEQGEVRS